MADDGSEFVAAVGGLERLERSRPQYRYEAVDVYAGTASLEGQSQEAELRAVPEGSPPPVEEAFSDAAQSWWSVSDEEGVLDLLRWGKSPRPWVLVADEGRETLADAWDAMDDGEVTTVVGDVGRTLAAAGDEGVSHGNLRPAHVLVPDGGGTLVDDWGLGRAVAEARDGTFVTGFTAPEQLDASPSRGRAVDTYGLAAVTYFALAERPPFPEDREAILGERPQPLSEFRPDLPEEVHRLVMSGLDVDPGARPTSPREFATAFEDAMPGAGDSAAGGVAAGGAAAGGAAGSAGGSTAGAAAGGVAGGAAGGGPGDGEADKSATGGDGSDEGSTAEEPTGRDATGEATDAVAEPDRPAREDEAGATPDAGGRPEPPDERASPQEADRPPEPEEPTGGRRPAEGEGGPVEGSRPSPDAEGGVATGERTEEPEESDDEPRVSRRTLLAGGGAVATLAALGVGAWAFLGGGGSEPGVDLSVVPDRAQSLALVDVAGLREDQAFRSAMNARLPLSVPFFDTDTLSGVFDGVKATTGMDPADVERALVFAASSGGPSAYTGVVLKTGWSDSELKSSLRGAARSLDEETYAGSTLLTVSYPGVSFPLAVGSVGDGRYVFGTRQEVEDALEAAEGSGTSVGGRQVEAFRAAGDGSVRFGSLVPPETVATLVPDAAPDTVASAFATAAENVEYVYGSVGADRQVGLHAQAGSTDAAKTVAAQVRAATRLVASRLGSLDAGGADTLAARLDEATVSRDGSTVSVTVGDAYELLAAGLALADASV